jgi:hypothetical protein
MPRIPESILRSVFYLYENADDARAGKDPGGTGFIVGSWPYGTLYAVTNWHVAVDHEHPIHPVIRLNTKDGGVDVIDLGPEDWEFVPGSDDIAIYVLNPSPIHQFSYVPMNMFVSDPARLGGGGQTVFVGDDAFMLGLFVDHAGETTNIPGARFGNVSMLPSPKAKVEQPTGYMGESYVVDMHSRTGFSGSPVFVYRTFGTDLTVDREQRLRDFTVTYRSGGPTKQGIYKADATFRSENMFKFLGIHWGQFPEEWEIGKPAVALAEESRKQLIKGGEYVKGVSGMTCVIPAWRIKEVLDMPKFKEPRDQKAREMYDSLRATSPKAESTGVSDPPASDANPNAREDHP